MFLAGKIKTSKEIYTKIIFQTQHHTQFQISFQIRGFQGDMENEFYLDLEKPLDKSLKQKYDVVFNHTVLEHVYEVQKLFKTFAQCRKI